jgi:hypothetical protein
MSLYKTIGLPMNEIDMLDNWVAWLHSGKSVVPRDFHREVDRFEARVDPDPLRGRLVDEVYGKWLRHNAAQAKVIVALCMGAPKGRIRALSDDPALMQDHIEGFRVVKKRLSQREAELLLRQFAREVGEINIDSAVSAELAKISRAKPMRTIPEFRFAAKRLKVGSREWIDEQRKLERVAA